MFLTQLSLAREFFRGALAYLRRFGFVGCIGAKKYTNCENKRRFFLVDYAGANPLYLDTGARCNMRLSNTIVLSILFINH